MYVWLVLLVCQKPIYSSQDIEEVGEEEITNQPTKKSRKRTGEYTPPAVYKIPDLDDHSTELIHVHKKGLRLTLTDLEDGDYPSWLIAKAASVISPFHLATSDPFPDRGDTELSSFCATVFNLAYDQVLEDAPTSDSDDETESNNTENTLALQLHSRKNSYSARTTFRYRNEMNKLASIHSHSLPFIHHHLIHPAIRFDQAYQHSEISSNPLQTRLCYMNISSTI